MDWSLFWAAFGAVGQAVGAVATAAAVIVALWQTRFNQRKKLKVSFSDAVTILSPAYDKKYEFISVTITNIGNRETVINSWGFELLGGKTMMFVPDTTQIGIAIQPPLPQRLDLEDSITLYQRKTLFIQAISGSIKEGVLMPDQPIRFYVIDSTGKKYHVCTPKPASDYCNEQK